MDQPLHSNEVSCAVHAWHPDGLALWGGVFGPMSDSTRTEIAAGLLALSGPGPVHFASDSLNFVRDATRILEGARQGREKPWSLMPNGDLWAIFDEHVTHKGKHAIKATWVKGHATDQHIVDGVTTHTHKVNNDRVDKLARMGVDLHDLHAAYMAAAYAKRLALSQQVTMRVHDMILRVLAASSASREAKARREVILKGGKGLLAFVTVSTLEYGLPDSGFVPLFYNPFVADMFSQDTTFVHIWAFLSKLVHMPVVHGQQGISWLELFILFELHGGALDVKSQLTTKATCTRISTLKALGTFKLWAKRVITQCGDINVHNLYKACKVSKLRLKPLGFTTFVSCVCFLPVLDHEHAFALNSALLTLRGKVTRNTLCNLRNGMHKVLPRKLALRAAPPWRDMHLITHHLPGTIEAARAVHIVDEQELQARIRKAANFTIACPKCGHLKRVGHIRLFKSSKWTSLFCISCKAHCSSRRWQCSCNKLWLACEQHAILGYCCGQNRTEVLTPNPASILESANPPIASRSSSGISLLTRASKRGVSVRDGQFSNTRVVSAHVEPAVPTSATVVTVEHVVPNQPTSATLSSVVSSSASASSEQFSQCPTVDLNAQLAVFDAASSMHQHSSGTTRLKRGGNEGAHASVKRACLRSGSNRASVAKRGLKRKASDPVEAINRLRAARSTPLL